MTNKQRIFYADCDPSSSDEMIRWLRNTYSCRVTAASDGVESAELIRTGPFDLYLLEYCLPDITAVDLCPYIRRFDAFAPILIYSALDREIDRRRALESGADKYLVKPDDEPRLRPVIDVLLSEGLFRRKRLEGVSRPDVPGIPPRRPAYKRRRASGII